MAQLEFWIQLENHRWDICPSGKDRMTGMDVQDFPGGKPPVTVSLHSPVTGVNRTVKMFQPVRDSEGDITDALIFRRYTPNWAAPDDRKVNPWDLNERNPTDAGTMGTIPGPVIECSVGDSVIVHFRNMDMRTQFIFKSLSITAKGMAMQMLSSGAAPEAVGMAMGAPSSAIPVGQPDFGPRGRGDLFPPFFKPLPLLQRTHSMHTHGFVFAPTSDGAYPLTPPDPTQPVGLEASMWAGVGVTGAFKQGDRVPPGATFTYSWNTIGWPTTQGVWLYHDHSVCDTENVALGAIGIVLIHPPAGDPVSSEDVDIRLPNGQLDPAFLPGGSPNGSPVSVFCFPFPINVEIGLLPGQLAALGNLGHGGRMPMPMSMPMGGEDIEEPVAAESEAQDVHAQHAGHGTEAPAMERLIELGPVALELNDKFTAISRFCIRRYRTPPAQALYLQLYHEFANIGMAVNGRKYLGNTPTVIGGPTTRMKFGVVGMGSMAHTFHIHGHRWLIPGPSAKGTPGLQFGGPMDAPVSQFEDTRVFGPANSFSFTIDEGNGFMRASPAIGEWHMHCHVLAHMMDGMMGSLLILNGGENAAIPLPEGQACPTMVMETPPDDSGGKIVDVEIKNFLFTPANAVVNVGDTVRWTNKDADPHSVIWDTSGSPANSAVLNLNQKASIVMPNAGTFNYHCGIHGPSMNGSVTVS